MYSRFTPGPDGVYQRRQVYAPPSAPTAEPKQAQSAVPAPPSLKQRLNAILPGNLELGDVLVLLIALLLLIDGEEDTQTLLIAMAAFFLL